MIFKSLIRNNNLFSACVPLGVVNTSKIPDDKMTASTFYSKYYYPYYGRLNGSRGHGAWCTKTVTDRTDYLQVDMGNEYSVCAVATQGLKDSRTGTTSYKLCFSSNAITWNTYNENNVERVSSLTHSVFCISLCAFLLFSLSFVIRCDFTTMFSDTLCNTICINLSWCSSLSEVFRNSHWSFKRRGGIFI